MAEAPNEGGSSNTAESSTTEFKDQSQAQIALQVGGGPVDQFHVVRYRGTEGLCQLYRFEVEVSMVPQAISLGDIVGKPAVLSVNASKGPRWFHGIVSRFEMINDAPDLLHFRVEIVPQVWLLTHRYNSRIFQNKTVPDIVKDVLDAAGIPSDRFNLDAVSGHPEREYCVQYRETDYNFICRLMEEEGIWWHFVQSQAAHIFTAAHAKPYEAIEGESPALSYRSASGMMVEEEHVYRFRLGQSVRPGAVVLNDFNFENPPQPLEAKSDASRDPGLEFYDYPGEYNQKSAGEKLARIRMEEFESTRTLGVGRTNSHRFSPGKAFELKEHKVGGFNGKYLITSVTHQGKQSTGRSIGSQSGNGRGDPTAHRTLPNWLYHGGQLVRDPASVASSLGGSPLEALAMPNLLEDRPTGSMVDAEAPVYDCRFECIPEAVTYRPPRITPWPTMRGPQTARVVGQGGEEIDTDRYGRVKVQFHWDRAGKFDEKSSCWIRVSQGAAGGGYGMMFIPRVGQEVIVDFLEGNPDLPIITGRVYNKDNHPAYDPTKEKTKSYIKTNSSKGGGGTNEIRFEDLAGSEQILLYAEKDLHIRANNDRVENIGHDHHLTVEENKHEFIKKSKTSGVDLDVCEKIGGKKSLAVGGDIGEDVGGNHGEKIGGDFYVKAGKNIVIEAGAELTLKGAGGFIKIDSGGVTVVGTQIKLNSGGSAGSGSKVGADDPTKPAGADAAKPGKDVTYSGGADPTKPTTDADLAGQEFGLGEFEKKEYSWIEAELKDEAGHPVPFALCRFKTPDGKTIDRSTDENGIARLTGIEPGECEISFVQLDKLTWIRGTAAGGSDEEPGEPAPQKQSEPEPPPQTDQNQKKGAFYHHVQPGETLDSIASQYGRSPGEIWQHSLNRQIRERRGDPRNIEPQDALYIPKAK